MRRAIRTGGVGIASALLFLYLTNTFPFQSPHILWSTTEDYAQGRLPTHTFFFSENAVSTAEGLLVGTTAQAGVLEWRFPVHGPRPTTLLPDWVPDANYPARIALVLPETPTPRVKVLSKNSTLHYRAIDVSDPSWGAPIFAIRFEGQRALLKGLNLVQSRDSIPRAWPFLVVLILLIFLLPGSSDSRVILLIVGVGFLMRWGEFVNYFSLPLARDGTQGPFFIGISKLATLVVGDSEHSVRFAGMMFACGSIFFLCRLVTLFGWPHWVGWLAGLLYALHPLVAWMSVQGSPLEVYTFLLLALLWSWQANKPMAIGVFGGLACLTHSSFFFSMSFIVLLALRRYRWKRKQMLEAVLPLLPVVALIGMRWGNFYFPVHPVGLPSPSVWDGLLWLFFAMGIGVCLRRSQGRWLIAAGVLYVHLLPMAFDQTRQVVLFVHLLPWLAMVSAVGMAAVIQRFPRKFFQAR